MPVRPKDVVHPADIRSVESVGAFHFARVGDELAGIHALADRFAPESGFHGVCLPLHDGREFARVVTAEPALVDKHRVWTVQKILETRFHGSFKARLHSKRRPAFFPVLRKMVRRGLRHYRAKKNPDKSILLDRRKRPYAMVRNTSVSPQRGHRLKRTGSVVPPAVILAFNATIDGLSLGKLQIAVRAAVFKCRGLSSFVAEDDELFPVYLQADRLAF